MTAFLMFFIFFLLFLLFSVGGLLGPKRDQWLTVRREIENVTDNWASLAIACLSMIAQRENCVNVLVTGNQLVPALSKVMLFGLSEIFSVENIYSSSKTGEFCKHLNFCEHIFYFNNL